MKSIVAFLIMILTGFTSIAQAKGDIITEKINVSGVCGECKERIENAAYIDGVKRAEWNKDTKELIVTFNSSKTSLKNIEESIAKAGHDAGDVKATQDNYNKLPPCCAYRDSTAHE